jgi:hypothetical protein
MDDSYERAVKLLTEAIEELDKRQARIRKAVTSFKKQRITTDACAAHRWLKANRELLEKESPLLMEQAAGFERLCKDSLLKFEADIHDAFATEGWSFSGQWPNYYVEYFLPVAVHEDSFSVTIGEEKLPTLDLKRVLTSAKAQLNKLRPDHKALLSFLQELHLAHSRLTTQQAPSASVWDVYREIVVQRQPRKLWRDAASSSFRPFRELEFRALLTGLLKANLTSISGRQMRLLPPVIRDESMYVYQPTENRFCHIGRIEFTSEVGEGGAHD